MKPRIFIGSSSEGLDVAKRVKDFFKEDYDCYLWTDNIFKNNESFLETFSVFATSYCSIVCE
jgi:predicted nucleotide-binding protein